MPMLPGLWLRILVMTSSLALSGFSFFTSQPAVAQITPDRTLGNESSRVRRGVTVRGRPADLIEGGTTRRGNLFHSFYEFNIDHGQRVYFANPSGIENILGRVTGPGVSDILGTLGVAGDANLFLLNPNGFIFGPNARLDIRGSFTASTGDRIVFGDGRFFSATHPQGLPLLTVSTPIGVQYGTGRGRAALIESQGRLVAGQNLTLQGGFLDLQGQVQAGGDLTLEAQNILQIRSTPTQAFTATSGGNMRLQGNTAINILSLTASLPRFASAGNLILLSDGVITSDARFTNGGNFAMTTLAGEPGYWVSRQNATVNTAGNYSIRNYTGPSLQVNAGGNIQYGAVNINAINPAVNPNYPVFALNAGGRIIGTGSISSTVPNLMVSLVSEGNIQTQSVTTRGGPSSFVTQAGSIIGSGNITSGAILDSDLTVVEEFEGGAIALSATRNILAQYLQAFSQSSFGRSGDGGAISLIAGNNISTQLVDTSSSSDFGSSGNGGSIALLAGNIASAQLLSSYSLAPESSADGGAIAVIAGHSIQSVGISSLSTASQGNSGNGGSVTLFSRGNILTGTQINSTSSALGNSRNGGDISLTAQNNIATQALITFSFSSSANSGNGGNIHLSSEGSIVARDPYFSSSYSGFGNSAAGGAIIFSAGGNVFVPELRSFSFARDGNSGPGGRIVLSTEIGRIAGQTASSISSFSVARSLDGDRDGAAGTGGDVLLLPHQNISNLDIFTFSSSNLSGAVQLQSPVDLLIDNVSISTSRELTIVDDFSGEVITLGILGEGQSGNIEIASVGDLSLLNSLIQSDTKGSDPAGDINIQSQAQILLQNSQVASDTSSIGRAGSIHLEAPVIRLDNSNISAEANFTLFGGGLGGNIDISGEEVMLSDSSLSVSGVGPSRPGNLVLTGSDVLLLQQGSFVSTRAANNTNGGNIFIDIPNGFIIAQPSENNDIIATAESGTGGRVDIRSRQIFGLTDQTDSAQSFDDLRANNTNDISVSSQTGSNGIIDLDILDANPSEGLTELPTDLVDASQLIAQRCGAGRTIGRTDLNQFVIRSRSGLNYRPGEGIRPSFSTGRVRSHSLPDINHPSSNAASTDKFWGVLHLNFNPLESLPEENPLEQPCE